MVSLKFTACNVKRWLRVRRAALPMTPLRAALSHLYAIATAIRLQAAAAAMAA
jgi:hypothetical protein